MISAQISGGPELRYVAGRLRKAAARDLTRELRADQRKAYTPLQREIKAEALASLPGAYAGVMSRAIKVSVRTRLSGGAVVTARIYATGQKELRDVVAVNRGILRHKTFGRHPWHAQRVRAGFIDRPVDRVADRVLSESADAAERVLQSIARS